MKPAALAGFTALLLSGVALILANPPAQSAGVLKAACHGMDAPFLPYIGEISVDCDDAFMTIASNGMAKHETMVGITGSNRQVPLPQTYAGRNAWRIPLAPRLAPGAPTVLQGPMAVAMNGVPIFDPTKPGPNGSKGDTVAEGELDHCNGHAGRADDYHYHAIPLCLDGTAAPGQVVGYGLDGFPVHTFQDAAGSSTGLDECNGKRVNGVYGYYATKAYPYQLGCLRGVVIAANQPQTTPLRPPGQPVRGFITRNTLAADGFNEMETRLGNGTVELIRTKQSSATCWDFQFLANGTMQNKATYCRGAGQGGAQGAGGPPAGGQGQRGPGAGGQAPGGQGPGGQGPGGQGGGGPRPQL